MEASVFSESIVFRWVLGPAADCCFHDQNGQAGPGECAQYTVL